MSVDWSYYDKPIFTELNGKYLLARGEGDSMASQLITAVNKLIYKWYNDGDVYDNTGYLEGWANDLSSYANWIYKYVPKAQPILDRIFECYTDSDYEDLLRDLCDLIMVEGDFANLAKQPKVGTIYNCDGPFEFRESYDDEWEDEAEGDWEDEDDDNEWEDEEE